MVLVDIPARICPAQLPAKIDRIIAQPQFDRSRWGILIQPLGTSKKTQSALYDRASKDFFLPASSAKLFTTAASLLKLGSGDRIRTSIVGTPDRLRLVGQGDPTMGDSQLQSLVQQLKKQNIQTIGQLTLDDRAFGDDPVNPTWEWGDMQEGDAPFVNSLILNGNATKLTLTPQQLGKPLRVQWQNPADIAGWTIDNRTQTVGKDQPEFTSITRDVSQPILHITGHLKAGGTPESLDIAAPNPAQIWRDRLSTQLRQANITVKNISLLVDRSTVVPLDTGKVLAFVESPPLLELINETHRSSNNLYAEAMLKRLGAGTTEGGIKVVQTILSQHGVEAQGYQLVDGAGLSRQNLVSPVALVQVLQAMNGQDDYRRSLPVAGQTGTLRNRFQNTPAQGIVQAKTGTVTNVSALAGYITPPQYPPLVFSILLNQSIATPAIQRAAIDEIVLLLTQLKSCE
jgi:serine-type D-Ala-D-Ala carboxypeptidase/endopeptidase (penicillin-binding protein 4)